MPSFAVGSGAGLGWTIGMIEVDLNAKRAIAVAGTRMLNRRGLSIFQQMLVLSLMVSPGVAYHLQRPRRFES
ncbi:hypothetical protein BK653_01775 [Pseudomonas brassicacearum]|nr:hypothetical protein BK653_01775 [Pseudomonas brassicacearum]